MRRLRTELAEWRAQCAHLDPEDVEAELGPVRLAAARQFYKGRGPPAAAAAAAHP